MTITVTPLELIVVLVVGSVIAQVLVGAGRAFFRGLIGNANEEQKRLNA